MSKYALNYPKIFPLFLIGYILLALTGCVAFDVSPITSSPPATSLINTPTTIAKPTIAQTFTAVPTKIYPTATPTPTLYPIGKGELITFQSQTMENSPVTERFISTVNVNSHVIKRLTSGEIIAEQPAWSPDGRYIAYNVFDTLDSSELSLYFMNLDGSNQTLFQKYCGFPVWSPNGLFIACDSQSDSGSGAYSGLYIFDLAKKEKWMVTEDTRSISWSPDSQKIAYTSRENGCCDVIFVQNVEGDKNLIQITSAQSYIEAPEWSPDGKYILFTSDRTGVSQIYMVNADGTHEHALTTGDKPNFKATWSPDGAKIVFVSLRHEKDLSKCFYFTNPCNSEIYIMDADGGHQTRLTNNSGEDSEPVWSPDGKYIAFTSFRDEPNFKTCESNCNSEIYFIDIEGKNIVRLTNNQTIDFLPVWQPKP